MIPMTEGIPGTLIIWKNKATQDFANVKDTDFTFVKVMPCPRLDGMPLEGLDAGYEWLANNTPLDPPNYDSRLFILLVETLPTNVPLPAYPSYNQYRTRYALEKRSNVEIISAIRDEENISNNTLINEAEKLKLTTLSISINYKLAQNLTLTPEETVVITRMTDVANKMWKNAANAAVLIAMVGTSSNVDISTGWELDNIAIGGYPFAN